MLQARDLYEVGMMLKEEEYGLSDNDLGYILVSAITDHPELHLSNFKRSGKRVRKKHKIYFEEKIRKQFYRVKNRIRFKGKNKEDALDVLDINERFLDKKTKQNNSIEGLVRMIMEESGPQAYQIIGNAAMRGAQTYHELLDGRNTSILLNEEYDLVCEELKKSYNFVKINQTLRRYGGNDTQ